MVCSDVENKSCRVEKRGCLHCGYSDLLDDLNSLKQRINTDDYTTNMLLNNLETQICELASQRDYYKKMYAETNNMFVK